MDGTIQKPTRQYAEELQAAYDFFNEKLFDGRLPQCFITYTNRRVALGHFWPKQWKTGGDEPLVVDEIALNPYHFRNRPIEDTLSTLVHEMTHQEQQAFGKPGRRGYHNRAWGVLMERVGLIPSATGEPGGKKTGQAMTHYIEEDGPFAKAVEELLATGFTLTWAKAPLTLSFSGKSGGGKGGGEVGGGDGEVEAPQPKKSKVKYTCPKCKNNAWGKPGMSLACLCDGESHNMEEQG